MDYSLKEDPKIAIEGSRWCWRRFSGLSQNVGKGAKIKQDGCQLFEGLELHDVEILCLTFLLYPLCC